MRIKKTKLGFTDNIIIGMFGLIIILDDNGLEVSNTSLVEQSKHFSLIIIKGKETMKQKEPSPAKPEDTKKASRERIIKYLNAKLSTSYKPNSAKTATPINARLTEGFTAEDFKTVIDDRVSIWLNDSDMQKFLRPETLFGPKFEGYLQNTKIKTMPQSKQPLNLNRDRTDEY